MIIRRPVPRGRRLPPDSAMRPRARSVFASLPRLREAAGEETSEGRMVGDDDVRSSTLSERLGGILDRLTRRGALTEDDVDAALREVRRALLEADVALDVVRAFIDKVQRPRRRRRGHQVGDARPAGRQDRPRRAGRDAGRDAEPIDLNAPAPVPILMVGLQGSGKTTTTAKIAKRLTEQRQREGADGLARHPPPGRDGAARGARPAGRRRDAADRRRPDAGRRSRSARCRPAGSAATTS